MYTPLVFRLPNYNILSDFIKQENLVTLTPNMTLPLFSLGFHHFIERTKEAMNITNKLETKNEFYYVVNPFEVMISNYDDNINNLSRIYFNMNKDKPDILSDGFYKMWEMNFIFDLIDNKKLTYASLAEKPGSFLQSIIYYREKILNIDTDKDNIFSVNVYPEKESEITEANKLNQFAGHYQINMIKTYSKEKSKNHKSKSNGDITDIKTISLFKKEINKTKKYANIVAADGENIWENKNRQEQESYKLILGEIIAGLSVLEKGGNLIVKIYDTFTIPTIKLIWLLTNFFEESYIYKPFFSRPSESEKYVICKNFKYSNDNKILNDSLTNLEKILKSMDSNYYLNNIVPDMDLPSDLLNIFKFINIKFVNIQQIIINNIVKYIKDNNYFGDKYHAYRNNQIEATKWWVSMFYPPSNNLYKNNKETIKKLLEETIIKNNLEIKKLVEQLV
jgi:23S rRNA U2552 (ribose-2'-O)-methylase RlmE/FtsJ